MGTLSAQTIPQYPNHTDAQGHRQGFWTILYDKDWKLTQDTTQAQFYRIIRYKNDLPVGKVRDYYRSGKVQMVGDSLIKDRPEDVKQGKFVWYYERGKVEQIDWFEKGEIAKKDWDKLNRLGLEFDKEGDHTLAKIIWEKAKTQAEKEFGKWSQNYATACYNLAGLYREKGEYTNAEFLFIEAKSIYVEVLGPNSPYNAATCRSLADLYASQRKYTKAESLYLEAKKISKKRLFINPSSYIISCRSLAGFYKSQGNYKKAASLYLEVNKIDKVSETDPLFYALSCKDLAESYLYQGKYADAEPLYLKIKQIYTQNFGVYNSMYIKSCNSLAVLYSSQGKYIKSKSLYLEAKQICAKIFGVHDPLYANICNNLALLYALRGKYIKAESLYMEAKQILVKTSSIHYRRLYATLCNNLALLYVSQGKYARAEALYLEAKQIDIKLSGIHHPDYAISCDNLAVLYMSQGKYSKALPLYLEARQIFAKTLSIHHPDYANSCNNLAGVYTAQGNYVEAKPLLIEAKSICMKILGKNHPNYATSCDKLASLYQNQGKFRQAELLYLEARKIRAKILGENHPAYATSCNSLAILYQRQHKFLKASNLWKETFTNLQQQLKQNLAYTSEKNRQQFLRANINYNFNAFNSFVQDYIDSLTISQSKKVLTQWYNNQLLTKALLFQSTQKTKERIYNSGDTTLIRQFEEFVAQRVQRNKVLEWTIEQRKQNGINLDSLNGQINALEKALARKSTEFAAALEEYEWHSWQEVKQQLKPGEVAVEIIRYKRWHKKWTDTTHYAALIVTPNSPYPTPVFLKNGNELEGKAFQYYQRRNVVKKAHNDPHSYARFWQPIQAQLQKLYPNAKRVFVSLDGVYHQINLETLWHPEHKKYLGELLDIRLVSSTKDLLKRGKNQPLAGGKKVQLFGFPTYASAKQTTQKKKEIENFFDTPSATTKKQVRDLHPNGHITPLPGTKQEVEQIGQLLQQQGIAHQVHLAQQASEDRVKALKNPRILHLATHGYFLQDDKLLKGYRRQGLQWHWGGTDIKQYVENPLLRCGLLWAGAEATIKNEKRPQGGVASRFAGENGLLTAQEALNLNLDSTQLVVLSACETGKGKIQNGEGVYGLQRAFLSAGAKNVLMSLWKVDDVATQWFMQYFYESWAKDQLSSPDGSGDVRKAYHYAQQKLRQDYPSPYYWGAFVLVGR